MAFESFFLSMLVTAILGSWLIARQSRKVIYDPGSRLTRLVESTDSPGEQIALRRQMLITNHSYWGTLSLYGALVLTTVFHPIGPIHFLAGWLFESMKSAQIFGAPPHIYLTAPIMPIMPPNRPAFVLPEGAFQLIIQTIATPCLFLLFLPQANSVATFASSVFHSFHTEKKQKRTLFQSFLTTLQSRPAGLIVRPATPFTTNFLLSLAWLFASYVVLYWGVIIYGYPGPVSPVFPETKFFLAAVVAMWGFIPFAMLNCNFLPLLKPGEIKILPEGLSFPLSKLIPLALRPIRLWADFKSVDISPRVLGKTEEQRVIKLTFHSGGSLRFRVGQLSMGDLHQVVSSIRTRSEGCEIRAGLSELIEAIKRQESNQATMITLATAPEEPCPALISQKTTLRKWWSQGVSDLRTVKLWKTAAINAIPYALPALLIALPKLAFAGVILLVIAQLACHAFANPAPNAMPIRNSQRWADWYKNSHLLQRLGESLLQLRPFVLWGLYVCTAYAIPLLAGGHYTTVWHFPTGFWGNYSLGFLSVLMIIVYAAAKLLKLGTDKESHERLASDRLIFRQNLATQPYFAECNFYHSAAFPVACLLVVLLGLPGLVTWNLFFSTGANWVMRYPTLSPLFVPFFGFVECYLTVFCTCACMLFFREWFTFPLRFASTEYDIELSPTCIKKRNVKGWFADWLYYGWHEFCPREIAWQDVKYVDYEEAGFGRQGKLPGTIFKENGLVHSFLSKLAAVTDALVDRQGRATYIVIRTSYDKAFWCGLKIRLWELGRHDRGVLLHAIKSWAPHAQVRELAFRKLAGNNQQEDDQVKAGSTGYSLREVVCTRGPLPESEAIRLASQLVDIVANLPLQTPSTMRTLITPDNLILEPEAKLKLIASASSTKADMIGSDSCYCAPEWSRTGTSMQADIFGIGATLHFLATGQDPEPRKCSSPKQICPSLSDELDRIVAQATRTDPDERYESFEWLSLELHAMQSNLLAKAS